MHNFFSLFNQILLVFLRFTSFYKQCGGTIERESVVVYAPHCLAVPSFPATPS